MIGGEGKEIAGDSTVHVLIMSPMGFSSLCMEIHFSQTINVKQGIKWQVSCTSHTCRVGLRLSSVPRYCSTVLITQQKWGLNLG